MTIAVVARVLAFFLGFPLGGLGPRVVAGLVFGGALGAAAPPGPVAHLPALVGELALGGALGTLAGIPFHAARGLRGEGPVTLGLAGKLWAFTLFFAVGGPALVLHALSTSFAAVPPGPWPDVAVFARQGAALFYGPLVLGLPLFLAALLVEPAAAAVDRLFGASLWSPGVVALRGVLGPVALLVAAPFLVDVLRELIVTGLA
jgi:hypothetical protein